MGLKLSEFFGGTARSMERGEGSAVDAGEWHNGGDDHVSGKIHAFENEIRGLIDPEAIHSPQSKRTIDLITDKMNKNAVVVEDMIGKRKKRGSNEFFAIKKRVTMNFFHYTRTCRGEMTAKRKILIT